ncbi:MAG: hypothetical protein NZ891_02230, partial [bacterium]|nr:hypothetical protein [bacterium]MDW8163542.1 hypothetical protein [Candidatus Omnitrophota bacterium]
MFRKIFSFLFFLFFLSSVYSQEIIKEIGVDITVVGTNLPSPVLKRIKESAKIVSERAMLNRSIEEMKQVKSSLEKVLQKIFNEVLAGFYVSDVKISPGTITYVSLTIVSSEKVVKSVKLNLDLSLIHPHWQHLFEKNLPEISKHVNPLLLGIPVESVSWAQDIITPLIESIFKIHTFFPGFSLTFDLNFGTETLVILKLKPEKPQIRDIKIRVSSETIPSIGLGHFKEKIYPKSKLLIGLPVEFVKTNSIYLKKEIEKELSKKIYQKFHIVAKVDFEIDEITYVFLQIDSKKYDATIEGVFNIGTVKEKTSAEARGWVGNKFTKKDKILVRLNLDPSIPTLYPDIGISHEFTPTFSFSVLYN